MMELITELFTVHNAERHSSRIYISKFLKQAINENDINHSEV